MGVIRPFKQLPILKQEEFNYDFVDVVTIPDFLNDFEIGEIVQYWNENTAIDGNVKIDRKSTTDLQARKSKIIYIDEVANEWVYDKLSALCIVINAKRYKFEILGFQSKLQLANYGPSDFFEWHIDFGVGATSNRKLSISIQLSDPSDYEGGELVFLRHDKNVVAPKEKGTAIIFPSFTPHRVLPVTKGSRKSLVGWIAGPPYK